MPVKLTDKVLNEGGSPIEGAIAQAIYTNGTTATLTATDTTDSKGIWAFDSSIPGHQPDLVDPATGYWYDVRINQGLQYRLRYGAIKAMMSMIYLSQTIVLGAVHLFDASLGRLKIPVRWNSDATPIEPGSIWWRGTDAELTTRGVKGRLWVAADAGSWYALEFRDYGKVGEGVRTLEAGDVAYTVEDEDGYIYTHGNTTITLPTPMAGAINPYGYPLEHRLITIAANYGTATVVTTDGTVQGGSFYNGIVNNGKVQYGDAITFKAMRGLPFASGVYVWVAIGKCQFKNYT